jgi:hypothetical protein
MIESFLAAGALPFNAEHRAVYLTPPHPTYSVRA